MSLRANKFRNHIRQTRKSFHILIPRRNRFVPRIWQTDCAWRRFKHYGNAIFCVFPRAYAPGVYFIHILTGLSAQRTRVRRIFQPWHKGIRIRGCRKRPDRGAHACIHARPRARLYKMPESSVFSRYSLLPGALLCINRRCGPDSLSCVTPAPR